MWENITSSTRGDATWEIIIMLLGAFILGYLLRLALGSKSEDNSDADALRKENKRLKSELESCRKSKTMATAAATVATGIAALPKTARPANPDDLKKIEGIGPKLERIMNGGGVWTFEQMADAKAEQLLMIIREEWPENKVHDPTTWPEQAALARDAKWDELAILQDNLKGGKR